MSRSDRKASTADLAEFGTGELAGDPSIAALIAALPESERESYRSARRTFLRKLGHAGTWTDYFEGR